MQTTAIRTFMVIGRSTVIASAASLAALSIAAPASAAGGQIFNSPVGVGGCVQGPPNPCGKALALPFTNTAGNAVEVVFTKNPNDECPNYTVKGDFDGVTPWTPNQVVPLAHGNHTINLDATCTDAPSMSSWGGQLEIDQIAQTGKPAGGGGAPAPQATVNDNVDLYDTPGGGGTVTGGLHTGDAVTIIGQCPMKNPDNPDDANNGWCHVTDTTQNVTGYVWGTFITH